MNLIEENNSKEVIFINPDGRACQHCGSKFAQNRTNRSEVSEVLTVIFVAVRERRPRSIGSAGDSLSSIVFESRSTSNLDNRSSWLSFIRYHRVSDNGQFFAVFY